MSVPQAGSMMMTTHRLHVLHAHQVGEALQVQGNAYCVLLERLTQIATPQQPVYSAILVSTASQGP